VLPTLDRFAHTKPFAKIGIWSLAVENQNRF